MSRIVLILNYGDLTLIVQQRDAPAAQFLPYTNTSSPFHMVSPIQHIYQS